MVITQIKKIGRGERYSIFIDGVFNCILEAEIIVKNRLKSGMEIIDERLVEIKLENGNISCFERALSTLERGAKTEKQIRDYLLSKGFLEKSVESAILKLKEYGYVDDEAYAENYIKTYSRSKGKNRLKKELLLKGISSNIINYKLDEPFDEEEEYKNCETICQKYLKGKEKNLKTKQKAFNHLLNKGFGFDVVKNVVGKCFLEVEDESWD